MDKELLVTSLMRCFEMIIKNPGIVVKPEMFISLLDQYIEYKVNEAILSHERDIYYHE